MSTRVLVIGATSAIAHAVARRYASVGARLYLMGRRDQALEANADDLRVRGAADVRVARIDAMDIDRHQDALHAAWQAYAGFDVILIAYGTLPTQAACEASVAETLAAIQVNSTSVIALMVDLANRLEAQGLGCMGVISSPAGERGRASNYTYGAAKAAVTVFASGLRNRLYAKGIRIVTIVPGFVDTPMTSDLAKSALWAQPERVAIDIQRALDRGFGVLYTPGYWRAIMTIIRHVPERLFVRLKL